MNKNKFTLIVGFVLIVAVFALIGSNSSSAFAAELSTSNCVDAYADGPDFIFNPRPQNLKIVNRGECLSGVSVDYGPTFLVNSHPISSGSPERLAVCPQIQSGAPAFLVNAEPTITLSVVGIEDKCSPG